MEKLGILPRLAATIAGAYMVLACAYMAYMDLSGCHPHWSGWEVAFVAAVQLALVGVARCYTCAAATGYVPGCRFDGPGSRPSEAELARRLGA